MSDKKQFFVSANANTQIRDIVKSAASNVPSIKNLAVIIETVDPKNLHIDDIIYTIVGTPADDDDKSPNAAQMVATKAIVVETLAGNVKADCITVNGTFDIRKDNAGIPTNVFKLFLPSKEAAVDVCKVLTEIEYDRAVDIADRAAKTAKLLQEHADSNNF